MKRILLFALLLICVPAAARAELTAKHVGIIAMSESAESQDLAKHYAKARGIPETRILLLPGKPTRSLNRETWQTKTRPAIRKWLDEMEKKDDTRISCLVTCWDVPLKIGRRNPNSSEVQEREKFLSGARAARLKQIAQLVAVMESLGRSGKPEAPKPIAADATLRDVAQQLDSAMDTARGQVMAIPDDKKRMEASRQFEQVFLAIGGSSQAYRMLAARAKTTQLSPEQAMQAEVIQARLQGLQQGIQALSLLPPTVPRDTQLLHLIQISNGLLGSLGWIDQERETLTKNETYSSFDSELSLIRWNDYPADRWQPNLLYYRFGLQATDVSSVVLVSRLAAPTLELAKGLVDKAIAAEKTGLTGKVYIDARGMTTGKEAPKPGSHDDYDQSLRDLAERLKKYTKLEVVLNDKAELFQPGECPDAALYCGWYSLSKYIDAFDWRPGAVGYHLASGEATTLRQPGATPWCNAMLEDGITATLGPVNEPYLHAFPKPDDFFPLLLCGKYCLAEVYYRTSPYASWAMVLVGDPLYNPFKNNAPLAEADLPERLKNLGADSGK